MLHHAWEVTKIPKPSRISQGRWISDPPGAPATFSSVCCLALDRTVLYHAVSVTGSCSFLSIKLKHHTLEALNLPQPEALKHHLEVHGSQKLPGQLPCFRSSSPRALRVPWLEECVFRSLPGALLLYFLCPGRAAGALCARIPWELRAE